MNPWSGDLERLPVALVLAELHRERATGALHCVRGGQVRTVELRAGVPLWAATSDPDEALAATLLRRGIIGIEDAGADSAAVLDGRLGAEAALLLAREHALELVLDLYTWTAGAFIFQPLAARLFEGKDLEATFESLASRGIKRIRSLQVIRRGAGALDARIETQTEVGVETLRSLDVDTCVVLGEVRSPSGADALPGPWPADFRVLQCVFELRLLGLVRAAKGTGQVEVRSLLRSGAKRSAGAASPATNAPIPVSPARSPRAIAADHPTVVAATPAPAHAASTRRQEPTVVAAAPALPGAAPALPSSPLAAGAAPPAEASPEADVPRTPQEAAQDWFKSGERFLRQLDFHNAISSYREAVRLAPENAEYRYRLGASLGRNPKWRKEAEENLLKAAELVPRSAKIQVALGRLYAEAGLVRRAEIRYRAAVETNPTDLVALRGLRDLRRKLDEPGGDGVAPAAKREPGFLDRLSRIGKERQEAGAESAAEDAADVLEV